MDSNALLNIFLYNIKLIEFNALRIILEIKLVVMSSLLIIFLENMKLVGCIAYLYDIVK